MTKLWRLRKSLTLQLSVVSVGFTLLAVIQFIIGPSLTENQWSAQNFTTYALEREVFEIARDDPSRLSDIKQSDLLNRITAENPRFRLYAETDQSSVTIGAPPEMNRRDRLVDAIAGEEVNIAIDGVERNAAICSNSSLARTEFQEEGFSGYAFATSCPNQYIELVGLEIPVLTRWDYFWARMNPTSFPNRRSLIVAGGVLLIGLVTLFRSARSVGRVAQVTRGIDLNRSGQQLSQDGLPLEIYPIIEALNDLLRRLDEARERQRFFLATSAHELRTPLTILRTRLERLSDDGVKEELRVDLRRMSELVERLLNLTQIRGLDSVKSDPVNLTTVLRDVIASRAPVSFSSGIELELETSVPDSIIKGDSVLLSSAFSNIIDNAVSVSVRGQSVTVEVGPGPVVRIRDAGPGIAAGHRAHIFEPFAKFPPNRAGHGLGLAIVYAIVQLHRGDVRALAPSDGQPGTVFEVSFSTDQDSVEV